MSLAELSKNGRYGVGMRVALALYLMCAGGWRNIVKISGKCNVRFIIVS